MNLHLLSHLVIIRDLSWWSGLFPFRLWKLTPMVSLLSYEIMVFGVWLISVSYMPPRSFQCSTPIIEHSRLYLDTFRRERAISGSIGFHPKPTSSPSFSTTVGWDLHCVLPQLHHRRAWITQVSRLRQATMRLLRLGFLRLQLCLTSPCVTREIILRRHHHLCGSDRL